MSGKGTTWSSEIEGAGAVTRLPEEIRDQLGERAEPFVAWVDLIGCAIYPTNLDSLLEDFEEACCGLWKDGVSFAKEIVKKRGFDIDKWPLRHLSWPAVWEDLQRCDYDVVPAADGGIWVFAIL